MKPVNPVSPVVPVNPVSPVNPVNPADRHAVFTPTLSNAEHILYVLRKA